VFTGEKIMVSSEKVRELDTDIISHTEVDERTGDEC
jgi:hypothetical protein